MRLLRLILAVILILGALKRVNASAVDDAFDVAPRTQEFDLSAVDQFLENERARYSDNGCVIVIKDGRTLLHRSYGSWTLGKVVPIASASKWVSGGVVMAVADDGKLSLSDTAGAAIPSFTGVKAGITLRQCFAHTSGLPFRAPSDFDPPNYIPNQDETLPSMAACADIIATVPLDPACDPPGSGFFYSGMGMQVGGRMAEIAGGKTWAELFQEKIAAPLGLTSMTYYAFGTTNNPNVAGSIETNVADLGRFAWMVVNNGMYQGARVLSDAAVEAMLSNQTGNPPIVSSPATGMEQRFGLPVWRYGVGCWLEKLDPDTGEAWEVSSAGAFGCVPFLDLKRNLAGAFLPRTLRQRDGANEGHAVYYEMKQLIQSIIPEDPVMDVLQNDPGTADLRIVAVTQPAHGIAVRRKKHVTYLPEPGFSGTDSFAYSVEDSLGNRSTATVTVTVNVRPQLLSEPTATPNPITLP